MDFLTICKRTNDIVGFQGVVTSVSTTGYQKVLTQAVKDSWEDIQRFRTDWEYMKAHKQVNVSDAAEYYTLEDLWGVETPDLAVWRYIDYNHRRLQQYEYDAYTLMDFSNAEGESPKFWAIDPASKGLLIHPLDQLYTLDIYYVRTLQQLVNNTDVPWLPERFHQAIIYGAVMKLSTFIGNPTIYDTYSAMYDQIMGQLMREENPAKFVRKRPVA